MVESRKREKLDVSNLVPSIRRTVSYMCARTDKTNVLVPRGALNDINNRTCVGKKWKTKRLVEIRLRNQWMRMLKNITPERVSKAKDLDTKDVLVSNMFHGKSMVKIRKCIR